MRGITRAEIERLHALELGRSGGGSGVRDEGALESALSQPKMTFDGHDLYPDTIAKAVALCFSLIGNHPFIDGDKRIGFAALKVLLARNDYFIEVDIDDAESMVFRVAAGEASRDELLDWVRERVFALPSAE